MVKRTTAARRGGGGRFKAGEINIFLTDYKRFKNAVLAEAERIMEEAAQIQLDYTIPFVPIETGALRESGRAYTVKTSKGVAGVVAFGGPDAPVSPTKNAPEGIVWYAGVVNFDTSIAHDVGQALFMEAGLEASKSAVDAFVVSEFRKIQP